MVGEGQVIEVGGQKYLVVFVEYSGSFTDPWVKNLELKGIKDDNK